MFDCHSHVQFAAFENDWKETLERARAAGISIINVGTQKDTSAKAVAMANLYKNGVYAAIGLHPIHTSKSHHDENEMGGGEAAKAFTSRGEEFDYTYYRHLAEDPKVVALGECGLDYYRPTGDAVDYKVKQLTAFLQHVKIAQETNKALMIHCRPSKGTDDAYDDLLQMVLGSKFPTDRAVLHFYVGSTAMTQKFLDAGFNFEFGGVTTFTTDYDEQIKMIPLDRITLETDSPYVAPEPYRGKRNEPAYVVEVAKKLAQIKGVSYDEVEAATDASVRRIFKI